MAARRRGREPEVFEQDRGRSVARRRVDPHIRLRPLLAAQATDRVAQIVLGDAPQPGLECAGAARLKLLYMQKHFHVGDLHHVFNAEHAAPLRRNLRGELTLNARSVLLEQRDQGRLVAALRSFQQQHGIGVLFNHQSTARSARSPHRGVGAICIISTQQAFGDIAAT